MTRPKLVSVFIVCTDLSKSRQFYQELGFTLKETRSRSFVFEIGTGLQLHLHEPLEVGEQLLFGVQAGQAGNCLVQSFEVESLEAVERRVCPDAVLYGPETAPWGRRILMLQDPDGHRLEFREGAGANEAQGN